MHIMDMIFILLKRSISNNEYFYNSNCNKMMTDWTTAKNMFVFLKFYQKFPKLRIQISTHPSIYPFHPSSQSLNISKMVIRESDVSMASISINFSHPNFSLLEGNDYFEGIHKAHLLLLYAHQKRHSVIPQKINYLFFSLLFTFLWQIYSFLNLHFL